MASLCHELADSYRVFEPYQRRSGREPLSVARHVEDLRRLLADKCPSERPIILGHSWGGMLALAFAAEHPDLCGPLVLVGCGGFDADSRRSMRARVKTGLDAGLHARLDALPENFPDRDEQMAELGKLLIPVYSCDPEVEALPYAFCDAQGYNESWNDMMALQRQGKYPQAFAKIRVPVLMLHGEGDPHPGEMIRAGIEPHLPQLEFQQWPNCGHYPWLERAAKEEFYAYLRDWLPQALLRVSER
jgi:pimeloyl-ACP methyl ester carboxylesterase